MLYVHDVCVFIHCAVGNGSPAVSLGFTILGEIFPYLTIFFFLLKSNH